MMVHGHWILDENGDPVPEPDLLIWAEWFEHGDRRRVAWTEISPHMAVSTIFLGLDHNFARAGPPILWETMTFRNGKGADMRRYASRFAAIAGHEVMVAAMRRRWRWRWVLDPWEWLELRWQRLRWWFMYQARRLEKWGKRIGIGS